jgi:NDP-sugar pyrophosphorylase family protein
MAEPGNVMGVVLAAGKGTRMHPFSERYPKPLLPVGGRALIVHQLEILARLGIREVLVVIGHLGHEVVNALGDGSRFGVGIEYVEQEQTLGIAHAVSSFEPRVDRPFLLLLGDIYFETEDLGAMIGRLYERETMGVLAVKRETDRDKIRRNFTVECDAAGRVVRVIEKPRHPRTDVKGCGIYLFDPAFFDAVRRTPRTALRDEYELTDAVQIFIDYGYRVEAADVIREDLNLSFARDLLRVNLHVLDGSGREAMIGERVRVHPGARIERCVVMDDVAIESPLRLVNSLVFPGTRVTGEGELRDVIITPERQIRCDGLA